MKFCTSCGAKLEAHMAFCTTCGTQAGQASVQQEKLPRAQYDLNRLFDVIKKNYVIIAIVASFVLIGIFLIIDLRDSTGLVGAWEQSEIWRGVEERVVVRFNRNQSGAVRFYSDGRFEHEETFTWEVTRDGRLALTGMINGRQSTEIMDFTVSRNVFVLDGEVFNRAGR